jgi:DNA helicase HerA-like ATPase
VPVFLADVKGDVAGLAVAGTPDQKVLDRAAQIGVANYAPAANNVIFWDLYGKLGHPVRTTVSEMGPTLLARILELNDTQSGVLDIVFKLADDRGLLLLDLEDLRALLGVVADERKDISTSYGLVSAQSIGAIQRALLRLEQDGAEQFFGEPALELADLMRTTPDGRGVIGILAARNSCSSRACIRASCCGCCRNCSKRCRKWATWTNPNSCSSSTKRTCCSTTRRPRCSSASNRSCA